MADQPDDVYNDPDNILDDADNNVDGGADLPPEEEADLSQSIYNPELGNDDRGTIEDLELSDSGEDHAKTTETDFEDFDPDSEHLADVEPADENDGTEE